MWCASVNDAFHEDDVFSMFGRQGLFQATLGSVMLSI